MSETLKPLPPKEAVDFFRAKGYQTGFSWQDVWKEEHAYSFTVAKAMRNDILQDIRSSVDKAISEGITFDDFRKQLEPTLAAKDWWGRKKTTDPLTGEEKLVQLGSPRRLRTIYETNLRSAYSAGRWERIQRAAKTRPYLRYVAVMDERTRDQHRAWHDTTLPVDHPFWQQHYPPNGWGCRCTVQQLSDRDLERRGLKLTEDSDLPKAKKSFMNKHTGEITRVPAGIDPGFDFNIGQARMKALTPPALDKPLKVPYAGDPAKVPFPASRSLGRNEIWQRDLLDEQYVKKFLREFDPDGKPSIFTDVIGEPMIISEDLFKMAGGRLKLRRTDKFKRMRLEYMGLIARTIKDPDEIWHVWEEYPAGRWTLRKKYLAKWQIEGEEFPVYTLFNTNEKGWQGITTFRARDGYIEKERKGALVYRRPEK